MAYVDVRSNGSGDVVADVCIVGAGPCGLATADRLSASGLRVVVIERGPRHGSVPIRLQDQVTGQPYPLDEARGAGIGGAAGRWHVETPQGGEHVRLGYLDRDQVDGRPWLELPAWPVAYDELSRWYPSARRLFELGSSRPHPADDPVLGTGDRLKLRVFEFARSLGFTRTLPDLLAAKGGVLILHSGEVVDIHGSGVPFQASSAAVRPVGGSALVHVRARKFVLAAGAIENARLLMDRGGAVPLGNLSGQLGLGFMEHPHYLAGVLIPSERTLRNVVGGMEQLAGQVVERWYRLDAKTEEKHRLLGSAFRLRRRSWDLSLAAKVHGRPRSTGVTRFRTALRHSRRGAVGPAAEAFRDSLHDLGSLSRHGSAMAGHALRSLARRPVGEVFLLAAMAEQSRSSTNRLSLVPVRGRRERPARIHLELASEEIGSMGRSAFAFSEELQRGGHGLVHLTCAQDQPPVWLGWGFHHMGTTIMSGREENGVVDPAGRVHGTQNLYMAGSSVFPTGGYANPTLTAVALACRLGDHLARDLGAPAPSPPEARVQP